MEARVLAEFASLISTDPVLFLRGNKPFYVRRTNQQSYWKLQERTIIPSELVLYLLISQAKKGSAQFPSDQAMHAHPMTKPRPFRVEISVVIFRGLWKSGSMQANVRS